MIIHAPVSCRKDHVQGRPEDKAQATEVTADDHRITIAMRTLNSPCVLRIASGVYIHPR
jgi:hypothetical protein